MMITMFLDVLLMCDGQGRSLDVLLFYLNACVAIYKFCLWF